MASDVSWLILIVLLTVEGTRDELIKQPIALPRRRLVVFGNAGYIGVGFANRLPQAAEGPHLPFGLLGLHLVFERIALILGCDRIGGTMQNK